MAQLEILEFPDQRLRRLAEPVTFFDSALHQFADDLTETLHAHRALGLSAPQVDDCRRILVMDHSEQGTMPEIFINPIVHAKSAWGIIQESCLSVPGVIGNVIRATNVRVQAQDRTGNSFERDLQGMPAVCLLHEIDHLDGKLFIDRLSIFRRLRFRLRERSSLRQPKAA